MAWLLLNELSKIFGRLLIDNVDEENMLELSPKFFTFEANITLLFLKVEGSLGFWWIVILFFN